MKVCKKCIPVLFLLVGINNLFAAANCIVDDYCGAPVKKVKRNLGEVKSLAFSPDGAQLIVGLEHGVIKKVWEDEAARYVKNFYCEGEVCAVSFSPDGSMIAFVVLICGDVDKCKVGLLDASTFNLINCSDSVPLGRSKKDIWYRDLNLGRCSLLSFNKTGNKIVVGCTHGAIVFVLTKNREFMSCGSIMRLDKDCSSNFREAPCLCAASFDQGDDDIIVCLCNTYSKIFIKKFRCSTHISLESSRSWTGYSLCEETTEIMNHSGDNFATLNNSGNQVAYIFSDFGEKTLLIGIRNDMVNKHISKKINPGRSAYFPLDVSVASSPGGHKIAVCMKREIQIFDDELNFIREVAYPSGQITSMAIQDSGVIGLGVWDYETRKPFSQILVIT